MQKGANAFAIEKPEMTKEQKKAKWMKGGGTLGLASKGLGALTFKDNKKKTQNEAYDIMNKCKTTGLTFGVANDLVPLSQLKITMDTAKVNFSPMSPKLAQTTKLQWLWLFGLFLFTLEVTEITTDCSRKEVAFWF